MQELFYIIIFITENTAVMWVYNSMNVPAQFCQRLSGNISDLSIGPKINGPEEINRSLNVFMFCSDFYSILGSAQSS